MGHAGLALSLERGLGGVLPAERGGGTEGAEGRGGEGEGHMGGGDSTVRDTRAEPEKDTLHVARRVGDIQTDRYS